MMTSHFVILSLPYLFFPCLRKLGWRMFRTPKKKGGGWTPRFSKPVNDWEMESVKRFLMKLHAKRVHSDVEDKVIWTASRKGNFSIKSLYSALEPGDPLLFPSNIIWSFCAPPKVAFFAWEAT